MTLSERLRQGSSGRDKLTGCVIGLDQKLATEDARIFKGRGGVEHHLATQGFEWLPRTLTLPGQLPCDDGDEALKQPMTPEQPSDFVTWDSFRWMAGGVGVYMVSLGVTVAKLAAMLRGHKVRVDTLASKLDAEHLENKADLLQARVDLLDGQRELGKQFTSLRRVLDDVLLQRGRGADVDRSYQKRKNGDE